MSNGRRTGPLVTVALLAGCVSLDAGPAFREMGDEVSRRTGQSVVWNRGGPEDARVAERVRSMVAGELTADQAVQVALLNNRHLQARYERLGIAQANLVQAGLLENPIFDAEIKIVEGGGDAVLEMAVAQDFLSALMVPLRRRLAGAELEAVQAEVLGAVLDLAAEVRVAFHQMQAAGETLALQRQILQAAEASYQMAQRLRQAGNITQLALASERALYEQAKLDLASSEAADRIARERVNALMGLWGRQVRWSAAALPAVPAEPLDLANLEGRAVAASVDLQRLRHRMRVAAARAGIEAAEAAFPDLAAGAAAEREPGDEWSVGPAVGIALPVWDWGQARTAAGRAHLRRLWNEYTALAVDLRAAVRASRERLIVARQQAQYYQRVIVPLAERITLETQLQYNAMQLGVFQLLQAKQREIQARRQAILARRDYWLARTELEQLLRGRMVRGSAVPMSVDGSAGMPAGGEGH